MIYQLKMWLCLLLYSWKQRIRKHLLCKRVYYQISEPFSVFSTDTIISNYPFLCCTGGFVCRVFAFLIIQGRVGKLWPADAGQILPSCFCTALKLSMVFTFLKDCNTHTEEKNIQRCMWPTFSEISTIWPFSGNVFRVLI